MVNYLLLAKKLVGQHVRDDDDMPLVYREHSRPLHDDWGLWPFTQIPRKWTTYLLPMPSKKIAGNAEPAWAPYQIGYPLAPGTEIRDINNTPHILTMHPVHAVGQWSEQAVWLDGRWVPCYYTVTRAVFGRRFYHNRGLKPDVTLGDFAWNFPEASLTFNKL